MNPTKEEKKYHHGNLKMALIEEGIKMMNEVGEEGMSLRKIAAKCGVSNAAPYAHFKNMDEMVKAMQEYVTEKFTACMAEAIKVCAHPDTEEVILNLGIAYVTFFMENPQYYKFLFYHEFMKIDFNLDSKENFPPFELLKEQVIKLNQLSDNPKTKEELELEILKLWSDVQGLASIVSMKNVKWNDDWKSTIIRVLTYHQGD